MARRLESTRSHGIVRDHFKFDFWAVVLRATGFGYNYRLTDLQASLGLSQLRRLSQIDRRRALVALYREKLKDSCASLLEELAHVAAHITWLW